MPNVIAIWHVRIHIVTSDIKQILGKRSLTRFNKIAIQATAQMAADKDTVD